MPSSDDRAEVDTENHRLVCYGSQADGRHPGMRVEIQEVQGEKMWHCPTCGWYLSEFKGEDVEEYI